MNQEENCPAKKKGIGFFERYLTVWVALCIVAGIALGKFAPGLAQTLDAMAIYVNDAPVISIPIAICLFFMMYPIMVKIDFAEVLRARRLGTASTGDRALTAMPCPPASFPVRGALSPFDSVPV
mgnify:CR=1 FL=1